MKHVLTLLAGMLALVWLVPGWANDTVYYYYTNTLHSAVVETNAQGTVVETTYYAPYGQVLNRSLRDGPGYTGHEEDPETGLNYMQQRYYDPQSGRFLSTDPVPTSGGGGNFNRYWYANDNPYRYMDPFGLYVCAKGANCKLVNKTMKSALNKLNTAIADLRDGASFRDKIAASQLQQVVNFAKSDKLIVATGAGPDNSPGHSSGQKGGPQTITIAPNLVRRQTAGRPGVNPNVEAAAMTVHEVAHAVRRYWIGPQPNTMQDNFESERTAFGIQSYFNQGMNSKSAWGVWSPGWSAAQAQQGVVNAAVAGAAFDCDHNGGCNP